MAALHPLAPITEEEFTRARDIVRKLYESSDNIFFRSIYRGDPDKADLVPFLEAEHAGTVTAETKRPSRLARVEYDIFKVGKPEYTRAVVDLATNEILSKEPVAWGAFPYFTVAEFIPFQDACAASDKFKEAMNEFSLPEGYTICIDPWPYGPTLSDDEPKYMQGLVFARDGSKNNDDTNHYAFPIPIIPVMDYTTKEVIRVDRMATGGSDDGLEAAAKQDKPKKLFENAKGSEYIPELIEEPVRKDLKPLNVIQPEGASFTVQADGLVEWQKWRFRVDFTPREGAVLHDVCYDNRPVVYRLSYSDLTVPYADPRPPYHRKQAFDFGDCGGGRAANNLQLGCDCLGAIHYFDSFLSDPSGSPSPHKSVVCLHEQDNGILWKHTNFRTDRAVVARQRELVIQSICTLANYEYIFAYKLDLAGEITMEVRATGILSVVAIDEGKTSNYGNVVAPGLLAQNHQHIFAARLDPAIDGYQLGDSQVVVEESHPRKIDPKTNPFGNLYEVERKTVDKATWIDSEPRLNRTIKVENPNKKNEVSGRNVGYKLLNPATQMMLADEDSIQAARARFAKHNNWVTGYRDGEYWVAGEFTNQSRKETGGVGDMMDRGDWFTAAGEANGTNGTNGTNGHDVSHAKKSSPVLWAVFGLTHNPRVEDWPVMPAEIHQMHFKPADFFTKNPAIDVPSAKNQASVLVSCCGTNGTTAPAQKDPVSHKQGPAKDVKAEDAGAHVTGKSENKIGKTIAGLLKLGSKDKEAKST